MEYSTYFTFEPHSNLDTFSRTTNQYLSQEKG